MEITWADVLRWAFAVLGGVVALLQPALPYILICTLAVLYDCYTAWSLGKRVHAAHPERAHREAHKFTSTNFGRVIITLIKIYALIVLAHLIQLHITNTLPVDMTKVAAGAVCFWQLWSILENESSCNGAKWARVLQRIMVDKTSRHFSLDLSLLGGEEPSLPSGQKPEGTVASEAAQPAAGESKSKDDGDVDDFDDSAAGEGGAL